MKIAFVLIPEKGHLNPYIGPAQALQDLGHDVIVAAPGDISAQLAQAGLPWSPALLGPGDDRPTSGAELVELIQDAARLDLWIEQLLLGHIDAAIPAVEAWLRAERPDVVVIDPLFYAAAIASHRAGLPWASVSNSLNPALSPEVDSPLLETLRRLDPRRQALFAAHGLPDVRFGGADVLSPYLTVTFATEALVGPCPHSVLVGPSFPIRNRGDEAPLRALPGDRPVVYASFGSQIYHWPRIFEKLMAAAERTGVHLVLSMGDLAQPDPPPHVHMYRYAPQLALLSKASLFITHGGANSVMEAIAHGVPLLISPMCNDQFHQAFYVARTGIGRVRNLITATVDEIAADLASGFPAERTAMARVAATYQTNGAIRTAELIAGLAC